MLRYHPYNQLFILIALLFCMIVFQTKLVGAQGTIVFQRYIAVDDFFNAQASPAWGLYKIDPFGNTGPIQFAQGFLGTPEVSKDGTQLLFSSFHVQLGVTIGLYRYDFNTGFLTLLTPPIGYATDPSFSPDETEIIYNVDIPSGGGGGDDTPTPTPLFGLSSHLSPSRSLAFNTKQVFNTNQITQDIPGANPYIAFALSDGSSAPGPFNFVAANQGLMQMWMDPDWHPTDRNKIVLSIANSNDFFQTHPNIMRLTGSALYVVNPEGTQVQMLFRPVQPDFFAGIHYWEEQGSPAWSPDGRKIAYARQFVDPNTLSAEIAIYIMNADGSDAPGQQVTQVFAPMPPYGGVNHIDWSPDGQWLTFSLATSADQFNLANGYDVFMVRTDGTNFTRLTNDQRSVHPIWVGANLPNTLQLDPNQNIPDITPTPQGGFDLAVQRIFMVEDDGNTDLSDDVEITSAELGQSVRFRLDIANLSNVNSAAYDIELNVDGVLFNSGNEPNGLAANTTESWFSAPWTAEQAGEHVFEWVIIANGDVNVQNNIQRMTFQVGQGVFPTPSPFFSPTLTNTPGLTFTPTFPLQTPTMPFFTPTMSMPTPTVFMPAGEVARYEFGETSLTDNGWIMTTGFSGSTAEGLVQFVELPEGQIPSSSDQRAMEIRVRPGEICFLYPSEPFDSGGDPVVINAWVRASKPEAQISLVALKGDLSTGAVDGSLATLQPVSAAVAFSQPRKLSMVYEPIGGNLVTPALQVVGLNQSGIVPTAVHIYVDKIEIHRIEAGQNYGGTLFRSSSVD